MNATKNFVCATCGPVLSTRVEEREEAYPVKGEDTAVRAQVRMCAECGEDIYDRELDAANLRLAYDAYRRNHGIITPDEIRVVRENYGLSQRGLGALLGWGEITIHRYEQGSMPDEAHNLVLCFIQDPLNMQRMEREKGHRLSAAARRRLADRLDELFNKQVPERVMELLARSTSRKKPSIYTGFREFMPSALMEMIVFYAAQPGGVLKTKLNKLLWYADFLHYRRYSVSISGATYVHLPYGPVPDQYELYLSSMYAEGSLLHTEKDFGSNIVGENLEAARAPTLDTLPATAPTVLEATYARFADVSSKEISRISHDEEGYINTQQGEPISYKYAETLKVDVSF